MKEEIIKYQNQLEPRDKEICELLTTTINNELSEAESTIWHTHPVWFIEGNPNVGYSKKKN